MKNAKNTALLFFLLVGMISGCRIGDCGCPMTYEEKKESLYEKENDGPATRTDDRSIIEKRGSTDHQPTE